MPLYSCSMLNREYKKEYKARFNAQIREVGFKLRTPNTREVTLRDVASLQPKEFLSFQVGIINQNKTLEIKIKRRKEQIDSSPSLPLVLLRSERGPPQGSRV